ARSNQLVLSSLSSLRQLAPLQFQAMRFHSVLLFVLALLPLSTALKCHQENYPGQPDGKVQCKNENYCAKATYDGFTAK
ncbi:hypothetical protein PMAYCL1PPCAC_01247, partial [Pristionchus mayeri]